MVITLTIVFRKSNFLEPALSKQRLHLFLRMDKHPFNQTAALFRITRLDQLALERFQHRNKTRMPLLRVRIPNGFV